MLPRTPRRRWTPHAAEPLRPSHPKRTYAGLELGITLVDYVATKRSRSRTMGILAGTLALSSLNGEGRPSFSVLQNFGSSQARSCARGVREDGCAAVTQDIARHLDVETTVTPEQLRDLMKKTDLRRLTNRMEELAEPATTTEASSTKAPCGIFECCGVDLAQSPSCRAP